MRSQIEQISNCAKLTCSCMYMQINNLLTVESVAVFSVSLLLDPVFERRCAPLLVPALPQPHSDGHHDALLGQLPLPDLNACSMIVCVRETVLCVRACVCVCVCESERESLCVCMYTACILEYLQDPSRGGVNHIGGNVLLTVQIVEGEHCIAPIPFMLKLDRNTYSNIMSFGQNFSLDKKLPSQIPSYTFSGLAMRQKSP